MSTREVAAQFDQISKVYDETREPLEPETLDALEAALRAAGVQRLLEVGVGTGRIAVPLLACGFDVTGIDASEGMIRLARRKGVGNLVRGSGYALPFPDRTFDGTLFVHVLHVLEHPEHALAEAIRASRAGAFAVVRPRSPDTTREAAADEPRRRVTEELRKAGYTVADGGGPARGDRRLIERYPPQSITVLSERDVTEPLHRRLENVARRGNRHTLTIPQPAIDAAVAKVRVEVGDREVTYHRVEALAHWSRIATPPAAAGAGHSPPSAG